MLRAGLKAGIIMGIVATVVDVILNVVNLSIIRLTGGESLPPGYNWLGMLLFVLGLLGLVLWFVSGILAGRFGAAAALTTAAAAGAGALAGAITEAMARIAHVVTNLTMLALGVVSVPFSPGSIQWLAQLGLRADDLEWFAYMGPGSGAWRDPATVDRASACMFCVGLSVAVAVGLGALGGIVGRARAGRSRA